MKRYDNQEIREYVYGSDLWFSVGDRILVDGVNDKEFFDDLFASKVGKSFKKRLDCAENRAMLFRTYSEMYPNEPIICSKLGDVLHKLMLAYTFIDPKAAPEEPEDTRPRDSLGRVMSPKAIQWQAYAAWCNDPEISMREIDNLRRTDPGFAEFYSTTAERQRISDDPMASVNSHNNIAAPTKKAVPADVQQFAQEYRTMSSAQVKTLLSPGLNPLGPVAAAENKRLFDAACACGAI